MLGGLRAALSEFFDGIGAQKIEPANAKFFAMVSRQMLAEIRFAANHERPTGEKAAFADFASAWAIEGKATP